MSWVKNGLPSSLVLALHYAYVAAATNIVLNFQGVGFFWASAFANSAQ